MAQQSSPSVLVVHPYWGFWETSVDGDLRADRRALLDRAIEAIGRWAVVRDAGLVEGPEQAAVAGRAAQDGRIDAVVVVCSMAVPATTGMAFLDQVPQVPVLLWAVSRSSTIDSAFSHSQITTDGAPVGTPMLASALARQARPYRVACSTLDDLAELEGELRSAVVAGRLRSSSLLVIGDPVPGYTSVVPPEGIETAYVPRLTRIPAAEFAARVNDVDEAGRRQQLAQVLGHADLAADVDPLGLQRAVASEVVLRDLIEEHRSAGGAFNCHAAELRPSPEYGIAPCLALGRLTSDGFAFTCTGDVLTAVAMCAVQGLGFGTLYHEIEALDYVNDEVVLSNSGEFDARLCPTSPIPLVRNVWYEHDAVNAPCAAFTIAAGPASLVGFAYAPQPRFIVAEGAFTGRSFPRTGMPHASFRFASGNVARAWPRWAQAGALHHSAATNAHVGDRIEAVAQYLGVDFVRV